MRARSAQKAILTNSTSFRSDFLNCFHLQPTLCYNSTNAPHRMNNQVVDMDINVSQKQSNAIHQKHTHDGKPPSSYYNCRKSGHWNNDCLSPWRSVPTSWENMHRVLGGRSRRTCAVDLEDKDNQEPTLGNQAGLCQGVAEGSSTCNHHWVPQSSHLMEHVDPFPRANKSTKSNRMSHVLLNGQWVNRPIHGTAGIRAVFKELEDAKQKDLLINLA